MADKMKQAEYITTLVVFYATLATIFVGLFFFRWEFNETTRLGFEWAFFVLVIGYTLVSLKTVGPDKLGLILRFGKPILDVNPGLKLVPRPICTLRTITRTRIQLERPGEPKQIWRLVDDKGKELPPGVGKNGESVKPPTEKLSDGTEVTLPWIPPYRITTAGQESCLREVPYPSFKGKKTEEDGKSTKEYEKYEEEKDAFEESEGNLRGILDEEELKKDPLHARLTVESSFIIRFRVSDFKKFIEVIHNLDEAIRQIEDTVISRAQFEFARRTPAIILAHLEVINRRMQRDVEILVGEIEDPVIGERRDPWGIKVEDVYIKLLGITETVNRKMADRVAAGFGRHEMAMQGEGRGDAREKELSGEAKGLAKIAAVAKTRGGAYALAATTTQRTFGPAPEDSVPQTKTVVFGPDIITGIMGSVIGAAETLDQHGTKTLPPKRSAGSDTST